MIKNTDDMGETQQSTKLVHMGVKGEMGDTSLVLEVMWCFRQARWGIKGI